MKIKFLLFALIIFIGACRQETAQQQEEKHSIPVSTKSIAEVIKHVSDELPLRDTAATIFFQNLDSAVLKKDDSNKKQEIRYKRYTFYYDLDNATVTSVWIELNPNYELTMEELNQTFKSGWQPAPSNAINIKTEDAVAHKAYTYSTVKGVVDIKVYSRHDKITGVLLVFKNKS